MNNSSLNRDQYPLVSIITGYYNRKENLKESVQSILDQDYPNFEFIIFDDCSTDGTTELLQEFSDTRLKVLKFTSNHGFTKGMIRAISETQGQFIAIHGAGDISLPHRITKQVNLLINDPEVSLVGCLLEDISSKGTIIHNPIKGDEVHFTQGEVMYRREDYFKAGGYNPIFKFAQFTNLKLELLKFGKASFINEVLYKRIHFDNGVTKNPKKRIEQLIYILIGTQLSKDGNIFGIDVSRILVITCINNFHLVKDSKEESLFVDHLKKRFRYIYLIYKIYTYGLLSDRIFVKMANKLI